MRSFKEFIDEADIGDFSIAEFKEVLFGKQHTDYWYTVIPDLDTNIVSLYNAILMATHSRMDMPVIKEKHLEKYQVFMKMVAVPSTMKFLRVSSLQPMQKDLRVEKILKNIFNHGIAESKVYLKTTTIVVNRDHYIIDGHHRFATGTILDSTLKVPCLVMDGDIEKVLMKSNKFTDAMGLPSQN